MPILTLLGCCSLPLELDGHGFEPFRNPSAVNAGEGKSVLAARCDGADFVFVMGESDCLENGSVGVVDGHNCIVRTWINCRPVLDGLRTAQDHTNVTFSLK